MKGDSNCDVDFTDLVDFHRHQDSDLTLSLVFQEDGSRYGSVVLDTSNRITGFSEKKSGAKDVWINAGVSLFNRTLFSDFSHLHGSFSFEKDLLPHCLHKNVKGYQCSLDAKFIDIGVPHSYSEAQSFF